MKNKSIKIIVPLIIAGVLSGCGIKDLPNQVAPGTEVSDDAENPAEDVNSANELIESGDAEIVEEIVEDAIEEDTQGITDENASAGASSITDEEEPEQAEATEEDLQEESADSKSSGTIYDQYIDVVKNYKNEEWELKLDKFALIDLDGDEVPELFATGEYVDEDFFGGMQPYLIVGNSENRAVVNDIMADGVAGAGGYRGTLYYLPGLGKIHDSAVYAPFGSPSDTIYIMKDGKIDTLVSGYFEVDAGNLPENVDDNFDILDYGQWYWDGVPVDEGEYKKLFVEAIENTHGTALCDIDYMSKDEIIKVLEDKSLEQD